MNRRVVVTGIGAVSPLGLNAQDTWKNALLGKSGIDSISLFDSQDCPVPFAGEVKGLDLTTPRPPLRPYGSQSPDAKVITQVSDKKELKKMGRFIQLSLAAGIEAYEDSGLDSLRDSLDSTRFGVNVGVGMGGLPEIEAVHETYRTKGYKRITPFFIPQVIPNLASGQLSILLNLKGPNVCNVTACSSSAHSIGESFHHIQLGMADLMLAGGAESVISPLGLGGFASMKALSTRVEEPQKASRPFDVDRDGFVMGEGSAMMVLEEREHALKRGAKIYGEIVGYGLSGDAYHMTSPAPEGEGGYRAMKMALERSGISKQKLHYVNAHGTSTPAGDVEEAKAICKLFPEAKEHLHISSTKSMTGHLLGAAGALEGVFALLATRDNQIPPTINLDHLDPECEKLGVSFTPHQSIQKTVEYALSNSFGFGGTNACLIFGKHA
ncbi:MAG: beta-ketoacyl-[acyl-carrier-protein] synthase II [Bdellovibrionaceae bacterium]|nr:beta-ketoacyl-[acyl-carrier-protein] synthase II [Pseudobdellovibrionaceae bacterium]